LTDWFRELLAFIETRLILDSDVMSDAARVQGSSARFGFGRADRKATCAWRNTQTASGQ
jgi:hypothetical protein